ncbi:MAG: hypothetical protein M3406_05495 [Chloroflexota bacterium]|nr:hypothetical protein [Chloroflexota bacterium]
MAAIDYQRIIGGLLVEALSFRLVLAYPELTRPERQHEEIVETTGHVRRP